METLTLNSGHWVTESVFPTHTELLNNWRPKDNFRFDPISDRQEKNHLVVIIFALPYLICFFCILNLADKCRASGARSEPDFPRPENWCHPPKVARNSFQHLCFDGSLYPLFITWCYDHGFKKLPNHWWTRGYHFRDTIGYHSNSITCSKHPFHSSDFFFFLHYQHLVSMIRHNFWKTV